MPRPVLAAILAIGLGAFPAWAQDPVGSFTGTVDGEAREWHLLAMDGEATSGWHDHGMFTQVEIFGFPQADSVADVTGALEISISLAGGASRVVGASVVYYSGGVSELYMPEDDEASVDLAEVRIEDDRLHLSGTLEADVFRVVNLMREELDPGDRHRITAGFDLVLDLL